MNCNLQTYQLKKEIVQVYVSLAGPKYVYMCQWSSWLLTQDKTDASSNPLQLECGHLMSVIEIFLLWSACKFPLFGCSVKRLLGKIGTY